MDRRFIGTWHRQYKSDSGIKHQEIMTLNEDASILYKRIPIQSQLVKLLRDVVTLGADTICGTWYVSEAILTAEFETTNSPFIIPDIVVTAKEMVSTNKYRFSFLSADKVYIYKAVKNSTNLLCGTWGRLT